MVYDIPDNLDFANLEAPTEGAPAPAETAGQPGDAGTAATQLSYDPNMPVKYKASGRDLEEPLSAVISRAQRGYDYAQLVAQHKQQVAQTQQEWQARQQQLSQMEQQWKPYHEYASQNPQWADYVRQQWENRFNAQQAQPTQQADQFAQQQQQSALPPQVQQELSEMRQFMQELKQKEHLAQQAAQDQALNTEIDSIRKQYPDIDFGLTDPETGMSLEARVIQHAQENRIFNFSAAFKDFYFEKLQERAIFNAKDSVAKAMQNQNKNGFLGKSEQSMVSQNTGHPNFKSMGYHQLMDLAAKDLGL